MTVLYDGDLIGWVTVMERLPRKFFGQFTPGTNFEVCRPAFEEAARWSRQLDETPSSEPVDYLAWDRWVEAIQRITDRIALPDLPVGIEEFAVDHESKVEVTFERAITEQSAGADGRDAPGS
jgi:hypothetical protein